MSYGVQFLSRPLCGLGSVATCWRIADANTPYGLSFAHHWSLKMVGKKSLFTLADYPLSFVPKRFIRGCKPRQAWLYNHKDYIVHTQSLGAINPIIIRWCDGFHFALPILRLSKKYRFLKSTQWPELFNGYD